MHPFHLLLLLLIAVPLLEIYLLIEVGGVIGAWPTVALVVITAVVGAALLRHQGLSTLRRVQSSMERGEVPAVEMLEGVVLLICGAFLLTPGFFTDALGFLALIPMLRRALVMRFLSSRIAHPGPPPDSGSGPRTIEGEFWEDKDS